MLPTNYKVPGVFSYFDLLSKASGFKPVGDKIVLIAQSASGATTENLSPVQIFDENTPKNLFGSHSIAYIMARTFFLLDKKREVWVMPIADSSVTGVARVDTITLSGTEIKKGLLSIGIGFQDITIENSEADTPDTAAISLAAAINANGEQPYTATAGIGGVVTLQFSCEGTIGNCVPIKVLKSSSGFNVSITNDTIGEGGPNLSAISGVLQLLFPGDWSQYVFQEPDTTQVQALSAHVNNVSDGIEQRGAINVFGYTDKNGTQSDFHNLCGQTLNDWITFGAYLPKTRSTCYEMAVFNSAAIASQKRPGDHVNGYQAPANVIHVPHVKDRLIESQINAILLNGGSPCKVENEKVTLVQSRSTYISSPGGGYVNKLTLLEIPRALFWLRIQANNMEKTQYGDKKNTEETRKNLEDSIYKILKRASKKEFEITQDVEKNKDGIVATQDPTNEERANVTVPSNIVPGLHQICNTFRLL